jgi:Pyruvate/2-oxoacid:ferredoxin oxidoreductase delta subunit
LLLGADAVAVDRVACALVGADPAKVPVFKASEELHAGVSRLEDISIIGDSLAVLTVRDFQFPRIEPMDAGALPGFLKGIVRDTMTARPAVDRKKCRLCGMCVQACPAEAMKVSGKIKIDYRSCIRCYCCVEACEHRAITIHTPLLARIVR